MCIRWDAETPIKTLKVKGEVKVSVSIRDGRLHYDWEKGWEDREDFMGSEELKALKTKVEKELSGGGKGKGKAAFT